MTGESRDGCTASGIVCWEINGCNTSAKRSEDREGCIGSFKLISQGLLLPCTNLFLWDILLCVAGISSPSHLSAYLPFCLHGFHFAVSVFFISFIQSSILFAMSAVTIMCLSSSGMVKVVSWSASSKINPVGFWMFRSFSVFLFLFSFSFDFAPSSLLALLPLTCARAPSHSPRLHASCRS